MPDGRLCLSRYPGQRIIIDPDGANIVIEVIEVRGNKTRLSFLAGPETKIYREEVLTASARKAPMTPIPLTPGEERVLAAWRQRPGTLGICRAVTGVSPIRDQPCVGAVAGLGLAARHPGRPATASGARASEAQYSLSRRKRGGVGHGSKIASLRLWDTQEYEWTVGDWRDAFINPGSPRGDIWRPSGRRPDSGAGIASERAGTRDGRLSEAGGSAADRRHPPPQET